MPSWKPLMVACAFAVAAPLTAVAEDEKTFTDAQKSAIEQLVHDYIMKKPEIVRDAIIELQRRDEIAQQEAKDRVLADKDALYNNPNDPVIGNPDGDVTVVEFFDYRCGYCKKVFGDIQTLLKEDGNIRYVLKEFPVLGPESIYAAHIAQTVWLHQQDKYQALHTAMMTARGGLNKDKVMAIAKDAGVDVEALKTVLEDPEVVKTMKATRAQAQALDINGTPGFLIGDQLVPGAVSLETLQKLVAQAREK